MPIRALINAFDAEHPIIHMEDAQLLAGEWTWEPASSRLVEHIEEGPLGSVDLTLRVLHDPTTANHAQRPRRGPPEAAGIAARLSEPLWKRLLYLLQPPTDLLLGAAGPVEWPAPLFPYQADAVRTLLTRDAILLADDTGARQDHRGDCRAADSRAPAPHAVRAPGGAGGRVAAMAQGAQLLGARFAPIHNSWPTG